MKNLSGSKDGEVGGHVLYVNADSYTPLRPDSIPTGEILPVEYAGIDFRQPRALAGVYDFNMILNGPGETYRHRCIYSFSIAKDSL